MLNPASSFTTQLKQEPIEDLKEINNDNNSIGIFSPTPQRIPHYCQKCHKGFESSKMLQSHNQSFHLDKSFVCEICGKAFRFRSNLAEHRSVHTAVKPFVCKFCGKSSRLKGNLTKHILKHHKTEQKDYIGTDDIIIKKGKKSVKDPAAIDFLEKSMIVLQQGVGASEMATDSRSPNNNDVDEQQQQCFFLSLGLDNGSSLDLKGESASENGEEEEEMESAGTNTPGDSARVSVATIARGTRADSGTSSSNLGELNSIRNSTNDQLLAKCSAMLHGGENGTADSFGKGMDEADEEEDEEAYSECISSLSPNTLTQLASQLNGTTGNRGTANNQTQLAAGSAALAAAACKALLFGANNNKKSNNARQQFQDFCGTLNASNDSENNNNNEQQQIQMLQQQQQQQNDDEHLEQQRLAATSVVAATTPTNFIVRKTIGSDSSSPAVTNRVAPLAATTSLTGSAGNSSPSGGKLSSTQCPECGKHLRKPRDLIAHLATIHKVAPPIQNNIVGNLLSNNNSNNGHIPIAKFSSNNNDYGTTTATTLNELRQLRQQVTDLKPSIASTKVEQLIINLDQRVSRLEKQQEMALNSIYTLVQLQTGINNQLTRFRDETSDQLKNIATKLSH